MDTNAVAQLIGGLVASVGPGITIGLLGMWAAYKKDQQCNALMERIIGLSKAQQDSNQQVVSSIDALRNAIRLGTESK